jgi:preprotein translocase subunit SecB
MTQSNSDAPQFAIRKIYVKDISFESPLSPNVFNEAIKPTLKVDLKSQNRRLDDNHFDVTLEVTIAAESEGKTVFIVEVEQAGVFFIKSIAGEQLNEILGIVCPTTLFPYLRETVDSLTTKGGFPPLNLAPISFEQMYHASRQKQGTDADANVQ